MNKSRIYYLLAFFAVSVTFSCSELSSDNPLIFIEERLSYEKDIKPIFANKCISCHSGVSPAGNYDLSSILKIIGNGTDLMPNVIIGSPYSLLLMKLNVGDDAHRERIGSDENLQKLYKWIVDDSLNISEPIVHLAGFMDTESPNFHGQDIRKKAWSLESCKLCHGTDYGGGSSESSCNKCHHPNPEDCTTCHGFGTLDNHLGAPPPDLSGHIETSYRGVGAHTIHMTEGDNSEGIECEECHIVPQNLYDEGHIFSEEPAEVVFSGVALNLGAEPIWDTQTLTCKNVYCHGNFPAGNKTNAPSWNNFDPNPPSCSPACHTFPPEGYTRTGFKHAPRVPQCWYCHPNLDDKYNFIDKSTHINGIVER